jgi:hypothetical protein
MTPSPIMDKNLWLAIGLSILVLMGWSMFVEKPAPKKPGVNAPAATASAKPGEPAPAGKAASASAAAAEAPADAPAGKPMPLMLGDAAA